MIGLGSSAPSARRRGKAKAIGLLPNSRVRAPKGARFGTDVVVAMATKPASAARFGYQAPQPQSFELRMTPSAMPEPRAVSMSASMKRVATSWPRPL